MKKKYLIAGYRDWAINVHQALINKVDLVTTNEELKKSLKSKIKYNCVFLVGWSELISNEFLTDNYIFCIHPSDLPKYRGGSPIQNQIIDGITESKVTLFKLDNKLDSGPIHSKYSISLKGELETVFDEIKLASIKLIENFIIDFEKNSVKLEKQNEKEATIFKRRKPVESEITIDDIKNKSATEIHNKIRCLQSPYPEPYIVCKDGTKIFILKSRV